jgi:hypothetical protein
MDMAGELNKQYAIDRIHRAYRDRVAELAETRGYDRDWLATWFEQFALLRVCEQRMHFNLASWFAWQDVEALFWKPASGDGAN